MKKIIALILAITCAFAMFSCTKNDKGGIKDSVASVSKMYESSRPTKIVTKTSNKITENRSFDGEYTLITGEAGGKVATVLTYWYETLRSVDDGSGEEIVGPEVKVEGTKEFLQDMGIRENGGKWQEGFNFAPAKGDIAMNLAFENLIDPKYENNVLTFSVAPDKAKDVLGTSISVTGDYEFETTSIIGNISVSIANAGSVITSVTVSYTQSGLEVEEDVGDDEFELLYPNVEVTVSVSYEYDDQRVTIGK